MATILAIDVAGYSHRVETDESQTLTAVAQLGGQIEAIADAHSGRLFHTAGDGFLVEFATVTGALEAADQLRRETKLPLRMGVHVGEVSVTPRDDLLGHGVNVAARLQARAPLNGILVSADVVRAERGELSKRFAPFGTLKLDKMREVLSVFLFLAVGEKRSRWAWLRRRRAPVLGVAGLILIGMCIAIGAYLTVGLHSGAKLSASTPALKVAVPPLRVLGDGDDEMQRFAGALQAEITTQLSQAQLSVTEPAQVATAAYGLNGAVERDGHDLVVRLRFDDLRQHVTVWSETLRDTEAKADVLQQEAANLAANVASSAVINDAKAKGDPDTEGLLIKMNLFALRNREEDREQEWSNIKLLMDKLPQDAEVRANLAIVSGFLAATSPPERASELRQTADREATAALRLNPRSAFAFFARYLALPPVGNWSQRERALQDGLKQVPDSALLTNHYSNLMREVGRVNDAVSFGRQAASQRPPSPNRDSTLLLALATSDKTVEMLEASDRVGQTWRKHTAAWNSQFEAKLTLKRWRDALELLASDQDQSKMGQGERQAWIMALNAMQTNNAAQKRAAVSAFAALPSAKDFIVLPPHEIYSPSERIGMIAILGGTDEAFAEASDYLHQGAYADSAFLFWPALTDFRRDRRFHELVLRIGLVNYWRTTGKWADFCFDKALPYDCKASTP